MAIYQLQPAFKDYLWGGTKLKTEFNKETDLSIVAESWEVSCHPDGPSLLKESQESLPAYLERVGKSVLGTKAEAFDFFPILIKFIDSAQPLSIQVHPDNDYALKVEHEYGKTEMWVILDAQPGATLYYGVNRSVSKEEMKERIENNTVLEVLNEVPVKKGDIFFIEAGTIHAIGAGIQICEIQQNSNSTYRVYDFGRVGADGKPRPLHIDKALDVANLEPMELSVKPKGPKMSFGGAEMTLLANCPYFTTYRVKLDGQTNFPAKSDSFGTLTVTDGELVINGQRMKKGDSCFIEANTACQLEGAAQAIYVCL